MKAWGLFLLGAGIGALIGSQADGPAAVPALVAVVVGLALLALGARAGKGELVGEAIAARTAPAPKAAKESPVFSRLGPQVENILSLAEEQAADRIAEAKATAAQILAEAHAEAARLKRD
ncbi:V-type ATP synthase subunit E family protein [Paractinoplanes durhamensis]|uniref:Uncharacterized protein n=1 Tax=Paractinoplanes durhamensis TaxID=113563 RepID=A0ABQ3ZBP2_9ACTN|nr:hypothetical protein [Actinoplanes durhamensis]GIE07235.1 hypothetical protein Adu01nite_85850 [Actinoplanes durhamensis]